MKFFFPLMILFVANFSMALPQGFSDLNLTKEEREIADQLKNFLSQRVYTLDRDLATFHYQWSSFYGPSNLNELVAASATWGQGFFNSDFIGGDMVG